MTGTSGEAERETGRDSEMQRCRKGNREGSALVIVWDPQKGKQGRLSSRDCVGPSDRAAAVKLVSEFAARSLSAPSARWRLG